jgi:hypothetical protein
MKAYSKYLFYKSPSIGSTKTKHCFMGFMFLLPCFIILSANSFAATPQPSIITGPIATCNNTNYTYSVTNVPGTTYTWTFQSGWNIQGTANASTVVVRAGGSPSTFNVSVTANNGTGNSIPRTLSVTFYNPPTGGGSINNPACQASEITFTQSGGTNFYWQTVSGGTSTALPATTPYPITASGTYYVSEYNGACWGNTISQYVNFVGVRQYYRSRNSGNWTNSNNWEFSVDGISYNNACDYPRAANSDFVIIQNGHKIIQDASIDIDKLTINIGGELEIAIGSLLTMKNSQAGADLFVNGTLTDRGASTKGILFEAGATWIIGASGTLVKTNQSSVISYKDNFEAGISTISATANWIYRYNGDGLVPVITEGMYYPNLTYESTSGMRNANGANEKFNGSTGFATIKGNFDVGGTGSGTVTVYNENTNVQAMLIIGSLIIKTGCTLNNGVSTSGTGFEIKGNVTINGTFNVNTNSNGILKLSAIIASSPQLVSGNNAIANNMNIQNFAVANDGIGSIITIDKDFNVFGEHSFSASTNKMTFGIGNITLKSNATSTAQVSSVPLSATAIVYTGVGRFIVERYLRAQKSWRFLATPVTIASSPTITAAWREAVTSPVGYGTQITGPASYVGMDAYTQRGSLKYYNAAANVWTEIANTANVLANNVGYMVFVRGDRSVAVSGTTAATNLRIKGMIRTGDQTFSVLANKFQSFGNPYPARIDFRTVTKANISNAFTVWNPAAVGNYNVGAYETYVWNGTNYVRGATTRNYIESGEAVFVQSNSATAGSVTVKESDKSTGS